MSNIIKSILITMLAIVTVGNYAYGQASNNGNKKESNHYREIYRDGNLKDIEMMSKTEQKPIMIVVTDKACGTCKKLDSSLHYTSVADKLMRNYVVKKLEASNLANMMKASSWGITSVPAVVFMNSKGKVISMTEGLIDPNKIVEESLNAFDKMKDQNNRYVY